MINVISLNGNINLKLETKLKLFVLKYLNAFVLSKIIPPMTAPNRPDKTSIKPIKPIFSFSFYKVKQLLY